jgi:anti-sigma factor RsiW
MLSGGIKPPVSEAELHGSVDGELDRERQEAVRAHLAAYPVDAARVETWQRQTEAIRAAFPPTEAAQLLRTSLLSPDKGGLSSRPWRERGFTHLIVVAFVSGALLSGGIVLVVSRQNLSEGALLFPPAQTATTVDEFQQRVQKLEPISPSDRQKRHEKPMTILRQVDSTWSSKPLLRCVSLRPRRRAASRRMRSGKAGARRYP